jgi:hypothetical protein
MDACVRLFCVYVDLCVGKGLPTACSPIQGALLTVYRIKKLKNRPRPNKKRATEPSIIIIIIIIIIIVINS